MAVLFALSLVPQPSRAASHNRTGGAGQLLPVLPSGELREPSTDRAESTDYPDITEPGGWDWDVSVVGGSADRIGELHTRSVEWAQIEVKHGLGRGLELSGQVEPWNQARVEQGIAGIPDDASGYGPTTLRLRQRVAGSEGHLAVSVSPWVRLPGSPDGPSTSLSEGGVSLPFAIPLGEAARIGGMIEAALVADAASDQRHAEGVGSLETARDLTERVLVRVEAVSVWSAESNRSWLGVLDGGFSWEVAPHLGLTLGISAGLGGGATDVGSFGRLSVHR